MHMCRIMFKKHIDTSEVKQVVRVISQKTASLPQTDSSVIFARWHQCAVPCGHIGAIWRIRLNLASFGPPESTTQMAIRSVQPFLRLARQKVPILYMHSCVLSNTGISSALTETGICTSLKSDLYFRFHSQLNTKSALLNFICTRDLVMICWKVWSPEPEKCQNWNLHTSKIGKLLPVCLTKNRRQCDHISEPHEKFGENR